jgi:hypothetical protein
MVYLEHVASVLQNISFHENQTHKPPFGPERHFEILPNVEGPECATSYTLGVKMNFDLSNWYKY